MATVVEKKVRIPSKVTYKGVTYIRQCSGSFTGPMDKLLPARAHAQILDGTLRGFDSYEFDPPPRKPSAHPSPPSTVCASL